MEWPTDMVYVPSAGTPDNYLEGFWATRTRRKAVYTFEVDGWGQPPSIEQMRQGWEECPFEPQFVETDDSIFFYAWVYMTPDERERAKAAWAEEDKRQGRDFIYLKTHIIEDEAHVAAYWGEGD